MTLYGKDEYYPFENEEFTNYFVENTFEVLEIPLENQLDISDKFSMKTYFIPFLSVISKKCSFRKRYNEKWKHCENWSS